MPNLRIRIKKWIESKKKGISSRSKQVHHYKADTLSLSLSSPLFICWISASPLGFWLWPSGSPSIARGPSPDRSSETSNQTKRYGHRYCRGEHQRPQGGLYNWSREVRRGRRPATGARERSSGDRWIIRWPDLFQWAQVDWSEEETRISQDLWLNPLVSSVSGSRTNIQVSFGFFFSPDRYAWEIKF